MAGPDRTAHPADVSGSAGELAVVVRSGVVESRHLGHAVLVDPDGRLVHAVGDPDTVLFPRSALKPWQAATARRIGASFDGGPLDGEALAIACGSHRATARHRDLVRRMLSDAGLDASSLGCPATLPPGDDDRAAALRAGEAPSPVAYNCSGKHTAMLLACMANGWPVDDYLDPAHPLQVAIRQDLETAVGRAVVHTAVDGCGAPAFAVHLLGLANAARAFVLDGDEHQQAVVAAMRAHPWAVRGDGHGDTVAMEHLPVVSKGGAEGVELVVTTDGWVALVKVLDGAGRAAMTAALALLARHPKLDVSAAAEALRDPVLGGGRRVGAVLPGDGVRRAGARDRG